MTLATTPPLFDYIENGVTLIHPIPFQFRDAADIHCSRILAGVETPLTQGTDFTVAGGGGGTGTVTKMSGGVIGTTFRVERVTTRAQTTDYTPGDDFPAEVHEAALDHAAAVDQEQDVTIADVEARALRLSAGEAAAAFTPAARRGMVLTFANDAAAAPSLLPVGSFPPGPPGTLENSGLTFRTPQQKGAVANNATDDLAAFAGLVADAKARGLASYDYKGNLDVSYGVAGGRVYVPDTVNPYFIAAAPIDVDVTMLWLGEAMGNAGGVSSVLRAGPGNALFRVQFYNTVNYTGIYVPVGRGVGGQGTVFDGLTAIGAGFNGTTQLDNPQASAFFLRARAAIRNTTIWNFQGDGIHIHAGVGLPEGGGASNWEVSYVWVQGTLNGLFTDGSDTNAGICTMLQCSNIRDWAVNDNSGAGNTYIAPLAQLCGVNGAGTAANPARAVSFGGQRYICVAGQEAAASVTAPSGTTSSTPQWAWYEAGGVVTGIPAWVNGMIVRAGGPYRLINGGVILGGYFEGSQPPPQNGPAALMVGGTWGGNRWPIGGGQISAADNHIVVNQLQVLFGGILGNDDVSGAWQVGRYSAGNPSIVRASPLATALSLSSPSGAVTAEIGNTLVHIFNVATISTALYPTIDNALTCGVNGLAWSEVWAHNGTIQTSDRNRKSQIRSLADPQFDALLDAVGAVPLVAFKMNDAIEAKGEAARDHYGIVAQDLYDELVKRGLDPFAGGVLGRDPVMEDVEEPTPVEQEATRTEIIYEDRFEVVDDGSGPRAVKRSVPVEREVPDFDHVPVHDEHGRPVIIPPRPAQKRLAIGEHGDVAELEIPASPARPMMHPVRKMVTVEKMQTVRRPKLDENGEQLWAWSVRYQELAALQFAWMQRQFKAVAA